MPVTDQELQDFCNAVHIKRMDHFKAQGYQLNNVGSIEFKRLKNTAKIIKIEPGNPSVFCFVDLANGNILKAASWKVPAKGARGNIANGASQVGFYGAAYLRQPKITVDIKSQFDKLATQSERTVEMFSFLFVVFVVGAVVYLGQDVVVFEKGV